MLSPKAIINPSRKITIENYSRKVIIKDYSRKVIKKNYPRKIFINIFIYLIKNDVELILFLNKIINKVKLKY